MHVALQLSSSFPFALPSALRTFLYLQGSADTFPSRLSEVCTPFMVCIRCSKLIYRYRNDTPGAFLVRSCRRSWRSLFFGRLAAYATTSL
jgi:hypothetical protein